MPEKMKAHAFRVVPLEDGGTVDALFNLIKSVHLKDRVRTVCGYVDLRVENLQTNKNGHWFLDFSKFRSRHGPGRAAKDAPIEGFEFKDGQIFCEETACFYNPQKSVLIIQYNHHGARVSAIEEYLNSFDSENRYAFELRPKYDDNAGIKFRNRKATKRINFTIDPRYLSDSDREAGTALTQALDMASQSNGEKIEIIISAGRAKEKHLSKFIEKTAEVLKLKSVEKPEGITKLKVSILDDIDEKLEVLDLIAQRLVMEFSDIPVGSDLRFPRKDRYRALLRAYNGWKNIL